MFATTSTSRRRPAPLAAAVAAATMVAALALAPGSDGARRSLPGGSPDDPCREAVCTASLAVGSRTVRWTSPETFYPNNEQVLARMVASRTVARRLSSYGSGNCKHRFYGSGIRILIRACGPETPISIRAVRIRRGLRRLTINYAADPYLVGEAGPAGRKGTPLQGLVPLTGLSP